MNSGAPRFNGGTTIGISITSGNNNNVRKRIAGAPSKTMTRVVSRNNDRRRIFRVLFFSPPARVPRSNLAISTLYPVRKNFRRKGERKYDDDDDAHNTRVLYMTLGFSGSFGTDIGSTVPKSPVPKPCCAYTSRLCPA